MITRNGVRLAQNPLASAQIILLSLLIFNPFRGAVRARDIFTLHTHTQTHTHFEWCRIDDGRRRRHANAHTHIAHQFRLDIDSMESNVEAYVSPRSASERHVYSINASNSQR